MTDKFLEGISVWKHMNILATLCLLSSLGWGIFFLAWDHLDIYKIIHRLCKIKKLACCRSIEFQVTLVVALAGPDQIISQAL